MTVSWQIPASVLDCIGRLPGDLPVVVLLRHSVRDSLPAGDAGYVLPITEVGVRLARQLGERLGGRLRTLHASPLVRCMQTAEALRRGAMSNATVVADRLLGDPGVYVVDDQLAASTWERLGHTGVMEHLVSGAQALPGMARPDEAAAFLVHHMLAAAGDVAGVHVFVTHDSLVTATAARILRRYVGADEWPWYLEGAFFWRDRDGLAASYRGHEAHGRQASLCGLGEADVIEFARREVGATVGLDSGARFFLAGGAFKTLLSGRPARDLDLWAPSDEDRALLIAALAARGAEPLGERPFSDAFAIRGRVVEIPHKTEPQTLEVRLARFDIGLAAVGVEHRPERRWRAVIHPLAKESVRRREVLLLKPLVNRKYALATLERMRRYALELGFASRAEEEAEVWRVFAGQGHAQRSQLLSRYERTAMGGFGVLEEAACRFP